MVKIVPTNLSVTSREMKPEFLLMKKINIIKNVLILTNYNL